MGEGSTPTVAGLTTQSAVDENLTINEASSAVDASIILGR